jgi:hypothetical protein
MKMGQCSEKSAYKIQTPGNYPEESIQHSEHGESLKSRKQEFIRVHTLSRARKITHSKPDLLNPLIEG